MTAEAYTTELYRLLDLHANEANAAPMKRYMKNRFEFLGIKTPDRRTLTRQFIQKHGLPARPTLLPTLHRLYAYPFREMHYTATELAEKVLKTPTESELAVVDFLLSHNQWWDTIDMVATKIVSAWMWHNPSKRLEVFSRWNESPDLWLNRTAILFQLKYREKTDLNLLQEALQRHAASPEFFHRKAIGWALREYAKTDPEWVLEFVATNDLAPLSRRNALKNIDLVK